MKSKIIDFVIKRYINSRDFNGLPARFLIEQLKISNEELENLLVELIESGDISLSLYINPHIKPFDWTKKEQLKFLKKKNLEEIIVYPTRQSLKGKFPKNRYKDKPFSRMLLEGYPQFHYCFFDPSVLDDYLNNPCYEFRTDGTTAHLYLKDKYYLDKKFPEKDKIGIQTLSYGYDKKGNKVIFAYLCYLHKGLTAKHQQRWHFHRIKGDYRLDKDYFDRSIRGEFTEHRSIYEAFLEEQRQINILCKIMNKPPLFKKEYDLNDVDNFKTLPKPTLRNFQNFAHVLDKLISENINKRFFINGIPLERKIQKKKGHVRVEPIGSINLLENWLNKFFRPKDPKPLKEMFTCFKKIRKLRQPPAHTIAKNEYDRKCVEKQQKLMVSAYSSIRTLRLIFMNHPLAKNYKPPEWLQKGKIKL